MIKTKSATRSICTTTNPGRAHEPRGIIEASACCVLALLLGTASLPAATIVWNGASGTDTNWSNGNNWIGAVAPAGDDVKFFDAGNTGTVGLANNLVDISFGGYIGSLQYANTNGFHTTVIDSGLTLNLTNASGLTVGTLTDNSNQIVNATITGASGTLNISNSAASVLVDQGKAVNIAGTQRAILDMSGLATFVATINSISVGTTTFGGPNNAQNATGTLKLAQTNLITTAFFGTPIALGTVSTPTNSIQIGSDNGNTGGVNFFFLGQTNAFFIDSICVGALKTTSTMLFNPVFANPVAFFRGTGGSSSRIRFWSIGDMASSGSSSAGANGTNDFSIGTVDALVDTMSLGRDRQGGNTAAGTPTRGTLTFAAGTIDVNNLFVGNQQFTTVANLNPMVGVINAVGAGATLRVNNTLTLGRTTANSAAATNTTGTLNVTNGTVLAGTITVGTVSISNIINLANATLIVTNTLATNALGLRTLYTSNSLIGLTVTANGSLKALVQALKTDGTTNTLQLDPTPVVFSSYPRQFPIIKYTSWTGLNNFGLVNIPAWAPGATLVSNGPNSSVDLVLPSDPRPVITAQPSSYSGSPGDNVTTNFSVAIAVTSVTPLSYQWYKDGVAVVDGATGNGSSFSGSTTNILTIASAQPADSASAAGYTVVITNIYGAVTSSPGVLSISAGATLPIITGPNNTTVIQGNNATFTASVAGNPTPAIRWQIGGADIPGATTSTLIVTNVQYPADDQAVYSIIASNVVGSVTNSATLTVIVPPVITLPPASLEVTNTQAASFTVNATGVPTPAFKWNKNSSPMTDGGNISGSSSATLSFSAVSPADIATYSVTITNLAGTTNSVNVTLTVNSLMAATSLSPSNGATGVFYDTPLSITFDQTPTLRSAGNIKIYNATNPATPVDTINLSLGNPQQRTFPGDAQTFSIYAVTISGNTATIYPHSSVMTSNQTYYVTADNGVFADANGAYFAGITDTNAWRFTTKPGGVANPTNIVVAADGSGDFLTVQGAVDSIPSGSTTPRLLNVRNGNYNEVVDIAGKHNVTFRGQSRGGAIVGYANNANFQAANGGTTHARMAFKVNANDIAIENMTVTNRTPVGGSQAEALMIESAATRFILNNATVASFQDTILANQNNSAGYFYNSLVQGQFDYIWGGGRLFFTNCEIKTLVGNGGALNTGNVTASRTDLAGTNGFSFMRCQFTRITNTIINTTVAGGNGTANGNVALISCNFDDNYTNASAAAFALPVILWEFSNSNLDDTLARTFGGTVLAEGDARLTAARTSSIWLNGWVPQLAPNILSQPTNLTVSASQPATFTVVATGISDPTFQWLKDGTNLVGQTGATLTINNASGNDIGSYSVIVSNAAGTVTSSSASLTVNSPTVGPTLATTTVLGNGSIQFAISGPAGSAGFTYRVWASTNLGLAPVTSTWTLLTNDTFGISPTVFTDADASGMPQRFYIITVP